MTDARELAIATAIVRLRELFEMSPYLAQDPVRDSSCIGHSIVTWGDLKTIQEYADEQFEAVQPESFTGCQLRGPGECQNRGMCLSDACKHTGKTIRPRYVAEPREDGIVYPPKETT